MLSLTKLFFDGEIKIFQDKDKLKQFMSTKPELQSTHEGIIHSGGIKNNHTHERLGNNKTQGELTNLQELQKQHHQLRKPSKPEVEQSQK
jgi:hypothetical protein